MPKIGTAESRLDVFFGALGVALVFFMILVIIKSPAPWFHDFAEWVYQGYVLGLKITAPEAVTGYVLASYPVPNSLASIILAGLTFVFSPITAGQVYLVTQLLAWLWLIWHLVFTVVPVGVRGAVALVLIGTTVFSSFFWYGFVSYQLAFWLFILFILKCNRNSPFWKLTIFGVLLFFAHAMIFLVWSLIILAWGYRAYLASNGSLVVRFVAYIKSSLPLLPLTILTIWYMIGRFLDSSSAWVSQASMANLFEALIYKLGYPLMLGPFRNILQADETAVFEEFLPLYVIGAFCNALFIIVIGLWGLMLLYHSRDGSWFRHHHDPSFIWVAFSLLFIYIFIPYNFFGLVNPGGRLLLPLLILLLLVSPTQNLRWWSWAAMPVAAGLLLSVSGYALFVYSAPKDAIARPVHFSHPGDPSTENTSVFAFNRALYSNTRYTYFNYRVAIDGGRFHQLQQNTLHGLGFRTGLLVDFKP